MNGEILELDYILYELTIMHTLCIILRTHHVRTDDHDNLNGSDIRVLLLFEGLWREEHQIGYQKQI